ncbi:hypothetical protein L2E82_40088 [Cichorium intybus]|uniref:Uncharacterized protein n=1 Tax=Cichorium intybus TaxID=13427 RepID=A0ACB9AKZ8_CICIN|nr:hypothetical protein L2E82_40088 [Cichorium intybus]
MIPFSSLITYLEVRSSRGVFRGNFFPRELLTHGYVVEQQPLNIKAAEKHIALRSAPLELGGSLKLDLALGIRGLPKLINGELEKVWRTKEKEHWPNDHSQGSEKNEVFPLQGYMFGSVTRLSEKTTRKKEHRTSLGE